MAVCACTAEVDMTEEDEAFEDLAKRQGDWGLQGSRKHQILRYAENVESKGTNMTKDEIIKLAKQVGMRYREIEDEFYSGNADGVYLDELEAFAKLVAAICAQVVNDDRGLSDDDAIRVCRAIRARTGEQA
jgi:hypothetical protein